MRIVYLHQYFNTPQMAGGTRSFEMARRLVAMGHEVHMVTSWRDQSDRDDWYLEIIEGISVHWLPVGYSNKMGFAERLRAFFNFAFRSALKAATLKADVVFATSTPLTIALPGVYAARRMRVPLVFEVRDLWPEVPIALGILRNPFLKKAAIWLEKFAYRNSSRVVALAPGMADSIADLGVDSRRISIIPNGCDLNLFAAKGEESIPTERMILYIGTIGPANGVEYIPRLAAVIRRRHRNEAVRFIIIGDGKNLEQVKALSVDLGLDNSQITFLGAMPKKDIPQWLKKCRLSIMTYDGPEILYRDSVSNKFFDSLAAGRPIVANFAGFSTLVAQGAGAGAMLSRDNLDLAADTLVRIINDEAFLENGRRISYELATETFDRDRLAGMLETVLAQAVNQTDTADCKPVGAEFRDLWHQSRKFSS
jgi:glycosyltransferase involved in cell wall biosynthesis